MMRHALRDYDEQVVNAEVEPEVRRDDPSAASGSREPRDAAGRLIVRDDGVESDADDEHVDADMGGHSVIPTHRDVGRRQRPPRMEQ